MRGARGDVDVMDIDADLEVDLARESLEDAVDGMQLPDLGPSSGGSATSDDADVAADASAAC